MIIDRNGIRCYIDSENKVIETGIMEFTDEAKSILEKNFKDIKKIYYESPDCFVDFLLLKKMQNLEEFQMDVRHKVFDVSSVNSLKKLKGFSSGKSIGELNIKTLVRLGYTWHKKSDISKCTNLEFVYVANCSDMKLFISQISNLKKIVILKFFRISSSDFLDVKEETNINELEFTYCSKLEDLNGLPQNFSKLIKLKFDHCKNIQDYLPLSKFENLEELYIFESAPISDLSFLRNMKKLKLLKIMKTRIIAKNIYFLDLIPKVDLLFTGVEI